VFSAPGSRRQTPVYRICWKFGTCNKVRRSTSTWLPSF